MIGRVSAPALLSADIVFTGPAPNLPARYLSFLPSSIFADYGRSFALSPGNRFKRAAHWGFRHAHSMLRSEDETLKAKDFIRLDETYGAHNYHPVPVVISKAKGVWVWDVDGKKYIDMLSSASAINQGHLNKRIVNAAKKQLDRVSLTSRAFSNDRMGPFLKKLCEVSGMEMALPMNTGAEAVGTSIKLARRYAHTKRGVPEDQGEIVVCENNFHGRTTTIISFSSDPDSKKGFGPYTPGFVTIPYNDVGAFERAINPQIIGILVEPIQGEAGI